MCAQQLQLSPESQDPNPQRQGLLLKTANFDFSFPESLIASEPCANESGTRVLAVLQDRLNPQSPTVFETGIAQVLKNIAAGDLLVINQTRVMKRRVFSADGKDYVFIKEISPDRWEVLFQSSALKIGDEIQLPAGVAMKLLMKGRPNEVTVSSKLDENYFQKFGELPVPPYIQKKRGQNHNLPFDEKWYQPAWAQIDGSLASPTASLHFNLNHLRQLKSRGVLVEPITLHVGLGTFLPIKSDHIQNHFMHSEWVMVPASTWQQVTKAQRENRKVWALGTTVLRALESCAYPLLKKNDNGDWTGETNLYVTPGFEFRVVDFLLTNFHQPKTTLLVLIAAFAGLDSTRLAYQWAIEKQFRLFSYGDLTLWQRMNKQSPLPTFA